MWPEQYRSGHISFLDAFSARAVTLGAHQDNLVCVHIHAPTSMRRRRARFVASIASDAMSITARRGSRRRAR
jgi:hypothetical protein